jgi:hypothetical protein
MHRIAAWNTQLVWGLELELQLQRELVERAVLCSPVA